MTPASSGDLVVHIRILGRVGLLHYNKAIRINYCSKKLLLSSILCCLPFSHLVHGSSVGQDVGPHASTGRAAGAGLHHVGGQGGQGQEQAEAEEEHVVVVVVAVGHSGLTKRLKGAAKKKAGKTGRNGVAIGAGA